VRRSWVIRMNSVIDLRSYVSASNTRLLVMVDLQERNYDKLAKDRASDLARSMENCTLAIRHARSLGLPIAFTRQAGHMVFERQQPSCYTNQLFEDTVSRVGGFAIAGLVAEETCLATAIDASHRGHRVTFLSDASASRGRNAADAETVHLITTKAIGLFADIATTRHWLLATSPRTLEGHRYG